MSETTLSPEFKLISKWIRDESRVLDLGCGDGQLLSYLKTTRNTTGYGMEIDPKKISKPSQLESMSSKAI